MRKKQQAIRNTVTYKMLSLKNCLFFILYAYATITLVTAAQCTLLVGNNNAYTAEFKGSCYMFSENKKSWPEAKKDCSRKYGGRLANIMDRETSDFINNYRNHSNLGELDAWIGLSWNGDQYTWNQYTGTTGTPLGKRYTNWGDGEPSTVGIYVVVSAHHGKWRNVAGPVNRGLENRYICQAKMPLTTMTLVTSLFPTSTNRVTKTTIAHRTVDVYHFPERTSSVDYSTVASLAPVTDRVTKSAVHHRIDDVFNTTDITPSANHFKAPTPVIVGIAAVVIIVIVVYSITAAVVIHKRRPSTRHDVILESSAVENNVYYTADNEDVVLARARQADVVTTNEHQPPEDNQIYVNSPKVNYLEDNPYEIPFENKPSDAVIGSDTSIYHRACIDKDGSCSRLDGSNSLSITHTSPDKDDPYENPVTTSTNRIGDPQDGSETYNHLQESTDKVVLIPGFATYSHIKGTTVTSSDSRTSEGTYDQLKGASVEVTDFGCEETYNHLIEATTDTTSDLEAISETYCNFEEATRMGSCSENKEGNYFS